MYYSMSFLQYYQNNQTPYDISSMGDLGVTRNTWEHWHLVPTSRPSINPPSPKTSYVSIEGRNGKLDLSQALTGHPTYDNRTGSIDFVVMNDYRNWQVAYTDIMTTIHGKKLMMVYEEDPGYYYVGRWTVSKWNTGKDYSTITFSYDLEPYKYSIIDCAGSWLWDPFNFNTGIIASRSDGVTTGANLNNVEEPGIYLLNTDYYRGDIVTDNIGTGLLNEQEGIANVIGNAPGSLYLQVIPSEGCTIRLDFQNPEVYSEPLTKIYTPEASFSGEDPDFVITNYTGVNQLLLSASGTGRVNWNFRPGRL